MTDHTTNAVADELAIRSLTAEYTDAINRGHVADAIATYAPDATFTMMDRPTVVGRDGIAAVLQSTVERYELIVQLVHSGIVRLEGDRATARWQITEYQFRPDGGRRLVIGVYSDEHVRTPDGWRFAARAFTASYLGDPSLSDGLLH